MKFCLNLVDIFCDFIIFCLICFIIVLIVFFGFFIYRLEFFYFIIWFDGIWWLIVIIFIVGYGDFVFYMTIGKLIGISIILLGIGFCFYYMVLFVIEMINK